MSYRILNEKGACVETHDNARLAARAVLILSAHDVKNGHTANYRCEPPTFYKWSELDLPEWALVALKLK
jgi:hypothetical protein